MRKFNIERTKNYQRISTNDVFTGQQVLNLLEISSPILQAILLLGIQETDQPATDPHSRYGVAEKGRKGQP